MSPDLSIPDPRSSAADAALPAGVPCSRAQDEELRADEFWRTLPAYADVDRRDFLDSRWQARNSVTTLEQLTAIVGPCVEEQVLAEISEGLLRAPMATRLTPYVLSLIEWSRSETDPIRRQYIPLASELLADHPKLELDPLCEKADSPAPGLTHRHRHAALFLVVDTCPVYCRYCTRSYMVGLDTHALKKARLGTLRHRTEKGLAYIQDHAEIEDVVLSGGDVYQLKPEQIQELGDALLRIPHVRRVRLATKGPAVDPMKLQTDPEWVAAVVALANAARRLHKQVALHLHFSHPREITEHTRAGLAPLVEAGVTLRSQGVLMRGVNDDGVTMRRLARKLETINVQPYYVYQLDMVPGVEDLRTPLWKAIDCEKAVRGSVAGFDSPTFVVDLLGGGGKRDVHSYEVYDRVTGISVYRSPNMDADAHYLHFDPLHALPEEGRERWSQPDEHAMMVREAIAHVPR